MKNITFYLLPAFLFIFCSCGLLDSGNEGNNPQNQIHVRKIYSINTDGTKLSLLSAGNEFILSQTGDSIFYCSNNIIYCMNIDGTNKHTITMNTGNDLWFSAGKNKILFQQNSTGKYYSINNDGSGLSKLNTPDSLSDIISVDISPSVNKIVFSTIHGMFLSDIDGNNLKTLKVPSNSHSFYSLHFTPDGNSIVYINYDGLLNKINLLNGNDTTLYTGNNIVGNVSYFEIYSMNSLLFRTYNNFGINIINFNNNSVSFITSGIYVHYSIDGSRISYNLPDDSVLSVYNLSLGTKTHTSVNLPGNYFSDPRLSQDNSKLIFVADSSYFVKA